MAKIGKEIDRDSIFEKEEKLCSLILVLIFPGSVQMGPPIVNKVWDEELLLEIATEKQSVQEHIVAALTGNERSEEQEKGTDRGRKD